MNDPKAVAAYHPGNAAETRPDLDALVAEVRYHQADWERIYGQPNYPENLTLAIRVADALAAERARADQAAIQALKEIAAEIETQRDETNPDRSCDEAWSIIDHRDGRYLGKTVALRMIQHRIKAIESAAPTTEQ